jgi:hypothetical protein
MEEEEEDEEDLVCKRSPKTLVVLTSHAASSGHYVFL